MAGISKADMIVIALLVTIVIIELLTLRKMGR